MLFVESVEKHIKPFFVSAKNFLDPLKTSDGKDYAPQKYKQLIHECYVISKNCNTSYIDVRDKLSVVEKRELLNLIREENDKNQEYIKKLKEKNKNRNQ